MNKRTIALTTEQYKEIIHTMKQGFTGCRPNSRAATALILEANLGLRISDIVKLRFADIVRDGDRYRLFSAIISSTSFCARIPSCIFSIPSSIFSEVSERIPKIISDSPS